jgi:hypothetical protein
MKKDKYLKITEKPRLFFNSDWFMVLLALVAIVSIFAGHEIVGTCVIGVITLFSITVTDDILPLLEGLLAATCTAIRPEHNPQGFWKVYPLFPIIIICLVLHFVYFRNKLIKSEYTTPMAVVSVAVLLGGVGFISLKEYFSLVSIYHLVMLGFGMVLVCMYFTGSFVKERDYSFRYKIAKMMVMVIIILCFSIFEEYFSKRSELVGNLHAVPFQWRNNGSTLLMMAMPFGFYLSAKRFKYGITALLAYIGLLFTGSRGGLLFGTIEFFICVITMLIIDKRHRRIYLISLGVFAVVMLLMSKFMSEIINTTLERFINPDENSIRLGLIERGIEDFKNRPIFGTGIGYMGNRDIHPSKKDALCWYHCSIIQVPASFGIVGIGAYAFLIYKRIKIFIKNLSVFNIAMFLSYIGLEMMSLVNPGLFAPVPYLLFTSLFFIIMEKVDTGGKESFKSLIRGEKK